MIAEPISDFSNSFLSSNPNRLLGQIIGGVSCLFRIMMVISTPNYEFTFVSLVVCVCVFFGI
jgi:hypothetical protein